MLLIAKYNIIAIKAKPTKRAFLGNIVNKSLSKKTKTTITNIMA